MAAKKLTTRGFLKKLGAEILLGGSGAESFKELGKEAAAGLLENEEEKDLKTVDTTGEEVK